MRKITRPPFSFAALAGLLLTALAAFGKPPTPPPAGCPACEIAYTQAANYTSGPQDLMLMKKDGTSKTVLLSGANNVLHKGPAWAPDGQWIAFITLASGSGSLRAIKNDGTGLTTLVTRCSVRWEQPAWRPIPSSGGYWLVYVDAAGSEGCFVDPNSPGQNLWAIHVSLGSPVLAGNRVCLTCSLNTQDLDYWHFAAWSRDGFHLSALQNISDTNGAVISRAFHIFDVSFESGDPVLLPTSLFELPGLDVPKNLPPKSWGHWSDSLVMRTNAADGTHGLVKFEIDLESVPKQITTTTVVTEGITYHFGTPVWSGDDLQLADDVGGISAKADGIYVITPGPPYSLKLIAPNSPRMVDSPSWKPVRP